MIKEDHKTVLQTGETKFLRAVTGCILSNSIIMLTLNPNKSWKFKQIGGKTEREMEHIYRAYGGRIKGISNEI